MNTQEARNDFLNSKIGVASEATIGFYQNALLHFERFFGDREVENITLRDLRTFRASLFDDRVSHRNGEIFKLSIATIRGILKAVRVLYVFLVAEGIISDNIAQKLEIPKLPQRTRPGIDDADREKMLEAARSGDPRDYAIAMFIADTACRLSGAINLMVSDLDIDSRCARVVEKGNKERIVFYSEKTAQALRTWLELRKSFAKPNVPNVFVGYGLRGKTGDPLTTNAGYQIFERLAKRAGVTDEWHPHAWRHAGARNMIKNGAPLSVVQQVLGHANITVTAHFYADLNSTELHKQADKYRWNSSQSL